ncbi:MAG: hypothetical protein VZR00_06655 [Lachnospiraceae bacterium]|nr:hypothetical protein [Lachnospiraceae bacterium]MEE3461556.1 hypothetical protein [Lachnospiraceae bacterium]
MIDETCGSGTFKEPEKVNIDSLSLCPDMEKVSIVSYGSRVEAMENHREMNRKKFEKYRRRLSPYCIGLILYLAINRKECYKPKNLLSFLVLSSLGVAGYSVLSGMMF